MKGNQVVRMVPWKDGKANEIIAASWPLRLGLAPRTRTERSMIRAKITDPWREVS